MPKIIDLTGHKYGKLTVQYKLPPRKNDKKNIWWCCKCDCGGIKETCTRALRHNETTSCGCINKINIYRYKGYGDLSGSYWLHIKNHAQKRNIKVLITIKQAWELFLKQNKKCALSGLELTMVRNYKGGFKKDGKRREEQTASLDRIDSNKDYIIDNIQWIHKDLNKMKLHHSQNKFQDWCILVANKYYQNISEVGVFI